MYRSKSFSESQAAETHAAGAMPGGSRRETDRERLEAECRRLDGERERYERDLGEFEAEERLNIAHPGQDGEIEAAFEARVQVMARMNPDLRTPLHEIFGSAQLLHLGGGLTDFQSVHVKTILDAGARLLDHIYHMSTLLAPEGNVPSFDTGDSALQAAQDTLNTRALRVLVVDDSPVNLEIATRFLRAADHEVAVAASGAEAITLAGAIDFDVILMDVRMPDIDGLEATQRIRALPGPRGATPIVGLTSLALQDHVDTCRAAGMNSHLAKPFRQATLNHAVQLAAAGRLSQTSAGSTELTVRLHDASPPTVQGGWIDIFDPHSHAALGKAGPVENFLPQPSATESQFTIQLTHVGYKQGRRRLVDSRLSCAPPPGATNHEFHWLLFVNETPDAARAFSTTCDLWRWSGAKWRSTAVVGAEFSPDEIFEHGWRYCGPCVDATATLFVT